MIPGIWAEKPFVIGEVIPPGPDPDGPDDLLIPGMFFDASPGNSWLSNSDYKFDGANFSMHAYFVLPPHEEFVAGGVYAVSVSCPALAAESTDGGVLFISFDGAYQVPIVSALTEGKYLKRSGYIRIPEDWTPTDSIYIYVFFNDDNFDFILHSIFKIIEDPDEILNLNLFSQRNDAYFTKLILNVVPTSGVFPDVGINPPYPGFSPDAVYDVEFDSEFSIIDTVSEITINIGYDDGVSYTISSIPSTAIITYLNASGGSGQFVVPSDWNGDDALIIRLNTSSSAYPVRIKSIKLAV